MRQWKILLEIAGTIVMLFVFCLFNILAPDLNGGRDVSYNLHNGYILESFSAHEWQLIKWTKEQEEAGAAPRVIMEGDIGRHYCDDALILLLTDSDDTYYCIDKQSAGIKLKTRKWEEMQHFVKKEYGVKSPELK